MQPKLFLATKAFIEHDGKVLVVRESKKYADGTNAGKYDVIGGRLAPGERFDDALIREIQEETGLAVFINKPFFVNEWRPHVRGEQWQVVGIFFSCTAGSEHVKLSGDHDEYKWIDPANYAQENLIENLHPAFEAYLNR
jgi:ADP-ribose pyrophosphatase YjhB (NUDIX family)